MKWSYGVTTVDRRCKDLLPRTLASLARAGFDRPHLFVDGPKDPAAYKDFGLDCTFRQPKVRTAGHWALSIAELYVREPAAERYALFQDDLVTCRNLRAYLERRSYPPKGYCNLYTFPCNQQLCPKGVIGWHQSNQQGKGAVALVFSREALVTLLLQPHFVRRPQTVRSWFSIDGGVVWALGKAGWREYVHNPSLVQHTGTLSTMRGKHHPLAPSFPGEEFDALELLNREKA